jgi:aminocarboxymuconate-semialdehyde decarboxylase
MRVIDSHFHWWPPSVFEELCKRSGYPRARPNRIGGYDLLPRHGVERNGGWKEWFDLEQQFAYLDTTGHAMDVVCSVGPINSFFSEIPAADGLHLAQMWNDEMAGAQHRHAGRLWASALIPMQDPRAAMDELERATAKLGLMGVNVPGTIGRDGRIDHPSLEPFYDRVEQLGIPIFMHPTDAGFQDILDGYNGALYNSLGRVIDVSVAAYRLVLSGIMERHPNLKVVVSHTGGALPYQAGRMDKNSGRAKLPRKPSEYLRRMFTDTVQPHALGMRLAIEFYGVDHVMYGSDYPCWDPKAALQILDECGISAADQEKIFYANARRNLGLKDPVPAKSKQAAAVQ